jgi:hypothetical protein
MRTSSCHRMNGCRNPSMIGFHRGYIVYDLRTSANGDASGTRRTSSNRRLHYCRNPNSVPSLRFMFVERQIVPVVSRLQPSQLPSLSSLSGTMRYLGVTVFRHNSDIVVDTAAPDIALSQTSCGMSFRHLVFHCTVVAIRITYGIELSPRSGGGCFVPVGAESVGWRLSYRRRRHLLPCARSPHSAVCSM